MTLACCLTGGSPVIADDGALDENVRLRGGLFRQAFEDVARKPREWTVRLIVDGEPIVFGTIVDPAGLIITKASRWNADAEVELHNGQRFKPSLVGADTVSDLALLQISATRLTAVEWRREEKVPVGSWVIVPGSSSMPVAVGVVGASERSIPREHGVLGISLEDTAEGVQVSDVLPNSGAAKAGLREKDRVIRVMNEDVATRSDLIKRVHEYAPGDTIDLFIVRDGNEMQLSATLQQALSALLNRRGIQDRLAGDISRRRGGFPAAYQHDAVIAPVHCGGSVVDLDGKCFGINIARAGRAETYALSASVVRNVIHEIQNRANEQKSTDSKSD